MEWDVFISHASEDKKDLVEPLAIELKSHEVKVWYDKFELKAGDSLSKSIDEGLANSKYGLVIISEAFLSKNWPDYEFRSLISKEVSYGKTILPIWHNITKEELIKYSPFLADKMALPSEIGIKNLALKVIEVVRPDIINSFVLKEAINRTRMKNIGKEPQKIELSKLNNGSIVHETVPLYLVYLSMIFSKVFSDIMGSYREFVKDFARDWDYDEEAMIWTAIALAFLEFIDRNGISHDDIDKKRAVIGDLAMISTGDIDVNSAELSNEEYKQAIEIYISYIGEIKKLSNLQKLGNDLLMEVLLK